MLEKKKKSYSGGKVCVGVGIIIDDGICARLLRATFRDEIEVGI